MDLSIVSPVYMSASTVLPLVQELTTVLGVSRGWAAATKLSLWTDGSSDQSWQQMVIASERYPPRPCDSLGAVTLDSTMPLLPD